MENAPLKLLVIVGSTRPGRKGKAVADWFLEHARRHPGFETTVADLAELDLPVYDEPNHPRMQQYTRAHTHRWSALVAAADAFVLVTPEYNYNPPPSVVNAMNYVYNEWNYKPLAFVSYGGISGGMRGVEHLKTMAVTLKMAPIVEAVVLPNFTQQLDAQGAFVGAEGNAKAAEAMLKELARWARALKPMRA